ncbi:carbon starvation CstA family protein, partial [Garicola koreensis]
SSKQLDRETDAKFVGYFGAVGEGLLALGAIIATTAGFQTLANWESVYESFSSGGVNIFVEGGGAIMNQGLGLPEGLSATILATMAVLFAATTMDTGIRLKRYVVQEIGGLAGFKLGTITSTVIAVVIALALTFSQGADGSGGLLIWPLFGTTNQLMAALTLTIVSIMLIRKGRPFLVALVPAAFVLLVSASAAIVQLGDFFSQGEWLLLSLDVIIIIASFWVMVEAIIAMSKAFRSEKEPEDDLLLTADEKLPLK